jgi:Type I restriction modification DNA specificity domain
MTSRKSERLSEFFSIGTGNQLSKSQLRPVGPTATVAYVSRTHRRNGLDGWTEPLPGLSPFAASLITVCLRSRNHALASFVQPFPFYTSYHVAVLTPKYEMSLSEKLWWCKCIELNRFRYNFGRQANRTLGDLRVPSQAPTFVAAVEEPSFAMTPAGSVDLAVRDWAQIKLTDLFDILPGKRGGRRDMPHGTVPWVSGSAENNGISTYVEMQPDFPGGCLTIASNGSIGATFYQPDPFIASTDVTVLVPKFEMSPLCGLVMCTLISRQSFRYNYARKWTMMRMEATKIPLPLAATGDLALDTIESIALSSQYSALVTEI